MPYKIVQFDNGKYKVTKKQVGRPVYMSTKYLSYNQALFALHLAETRHK